MTAQPPERPAPGEPGGERPAAPSRRGIDGISGFLGFRWEAPNRLRMTVEERHINSAGLLSGVATFAMIDYCMGSTLWRQTTDEEHIATLSISINYIQTATSGDVVCETTLDRRNDRIAVLRSEVRAQDGRLLATAIGSYSIFPAHRRHGVPTRDGPGA